VLARREQGASILARLEWALLAIVVSAAALGLWGLAVGTISI
jgi:hypothetical protein